MLFAKQKSIMPIILTLFFVSLMVLYFSLDGIEGLVRIIKTFVIFSSMYVLASEKKEIKDPQNLMKPLHWFMTLSAIIVCIDFILFFSIGKTIMNFTTSGFMPRPRGLMEDSNFFSYSMICYIMYLKFAYQKSTKILIISVFCSGSFSAIIMLFALLFFYKRKINLIEIGSKEWRLWRNCIIFLVIIINASYFQIVNNKDNIINYIDQQDISPLIKIKAISMFLRFDAQKTAIDKIAESNNQLFGGGPGITKTLNERGMNLHNTYYQIYVEMGVLLILLVGSVLFYYMLDIRYIGYLILFSMMTLFGNMLEVFYSPILPLIYFLYKINYLTDEYRKQVPINIYNDLSE